jgi:type I restriction enzyme S subunit
MWPVVKLDGLLRHRKEFVTIDDLTNYKRPRVQLHAQGVVVRDEILGALIKTKTQQVCRTGEFLVAEIDAKIGGFGIVPESLNGSIVSSHYFLFVIDESKLVRRFLDFFIRTPMFCEQVAAQGSTNYAAIRPSHVLGYEIPLPPLSEQRRIVARIEELAAQIQEARALRNQVAEEVDMLMAVSSRNFLSGSWVQLKIEDVCPIITDGTHQTPHYTEEGAIFLSAQNVKPFKFMPEKHRKVSVEDFHNYTARNKPRRGDVLLTRVGAGIGEAAVVDQDIEFAIYVSLALIRPDCTQISPQFLTHWLNSPEGRASSLRETLGRGHSQGNLNLKLLRNVKIPVPSLPEQRRIVAELDALQAEVDTLKRLQAETAADLDALLPAVLDRAFKGEL